MEERVFAAPFPDGEPCPRSPTAGSTSPCRTSAKRDSDALRARAEAGPGGAYAYGFRKELRSEHRTSLRRVLVLAHERERRLAVTADVLDEGGSHSRGRYHLRIGDLARAIHEVVDERGRAVGIPARREDACLERQRHGSRVTAAVSLIPCNQLLGDIEQLVPLAEVEQR